MITINGHSIRFDGETMYINCGSNKRHQALSPKPCNSSNYQLMYTLSYSPADGNKINGVSTKDIPWTPELTAFVKSLTGGAVFAKVYEQAKKDVAAFQRRWAREHATVDRDPYEL